MRPHQLLLFGLVFGLLAMLSASCGGTWNDDPKNFKRAFGADPPDGVKILRSHYWRSAHWSFEFEYYFQIESNESLEKQLRTTWPLREVIDGLRPGFDNTRPAWFAPSPMDRYEVWTYSDQPDSSYRMLIDKETGDIFLHDYQL